MEPSSGAAAVAGFCIDGRGLDGPGCTAMRGGRAVPCV